MKYLANRGISFGPFAQRRDVKFDDIEPVKQIFAETALFDILLQVPVWMRRGCAHSFEFPRSSQAVETVHPA